MGHGKEPEFRQERYEIIHHKVKAAIPTIGTMINDDFVDNDSAFIVPENCMVVTKSRPGEVAYLNTVVPLVNKVSDGSKQELFRNPLSNTKQLLKELGSVIVYKPGDKCPNYLYSLYSPEDIMQDTYMSHLGLLKAPLEIPFENKKFDDDINQDNTLVSDYINTIYKESLYPTAEQTLQILLKSHNDAMKGTNEDGRKMVTSDIPWTDMGGMIKFFSITQKELLQIGDDGVAKRPGVYYNFVCRENKEIGHNYFIHSENLRQHINPKIKSALTKKKGTRNIIGRLIGEAETKRKPLIRILMSKSKSKSKSKSSSGSKRKTHSKKKNKDASAERAEASGEAH
jgi:hypothetical protein